MRLPPLATKTRRVLDFFLTGKSSNRFEAEKRLHDHCLHSTVSTLQNGYGIKISRQFEIVRGYKGNPTRCRRYWIDPDERQRIKEKTLTTSDQANGKGISNSDNYNNTAGTLRQSSPVN